MEVSLIKQTGNDGHLILLKMQCDLYVLLFFWRVDLSCRVYPDRQIHIWLTGSEDLFGEHNVAVW
ncbi:hypothetical protein BANRA_05919 [Pseudomonas aeruginosa]|nr:hypothetical protein BANRA_05919 [Pseudomonas aeruginosa]